jgi:hypothetical protein
MKNEQPHPSHAGGSPVDQRVGRLPTEGTSLWPRPTLERAFAEMLEVDEQCREQMTAASKALSLAALASAELAQRAADTVRLSIMQRDNAAAELRAIGGQMANVCFNWSQEANSIGVRLAAGDREMLKSLHKQWDAAVARLKTPNSSLREP